MLIHTEHDPKKRFSLYIFGFDEVFPHTPDTFLAADELQQLSEITNDKRRREFLQSRYELKKLLAAKLAIAPAEVRFRTIGEGKPVLDVQNPSVDFNLSHSGDYFAIGLSEKGHIGIDIEKVRAPKNLEQIAARFFSESETQLIETETNLDRKAEVFAKFWSGKEALIKTMGGGVFKHVNDVVIDQKSWQIDKLPKEFGSLSNWYLQYYQAVEGYIFCIAFKSF